MHLRSRLLRSFLLLACRAAGGLAAAPAIGHASPGAAAQRPADICSAGSDGPLVPGTAAEHCTKGLPCCGAALIGPSPLPTALMPFPAPVLPAGRGVPPARRAGGWLRFARAPPG